MVILAVVLYECEIWFLTLKEEYTLQMFKAEFSGKYLDLRGTNKWVLYNIT
jgi:hypothetical protein